MPNEPRKWFDQSQPQTLQAAVLFCYLNAALAIIYVIAFGATLPLVLLVAALGANGIANEKRWGYWVAVLGRIALRGEPAGPLRGDLPEPRPGPQPGLRRRS